MQYAIVRYHDDKVTCAWTKVPDDAVMAVFGIDFEARGSSQGNARSE